MNGASRPGPDSTLAQRILWARLGAGFEVATAFADRIEKRSHELYRYEKGDVTPTAETLAKMAEATGVSLFWLVTGRDQPPQLATEVA